MTPTSKWVTHSYLTTSRSACYRSNYKYKDGWAPCLTCFMSGRPNHPYTCNSIGNYLMHFFFTTSWSTSSTTGYMTKCYGGTPPTSGIITWIRVIVTSWVGKIPPCTRGQHGGIFPTQHSNCLWSMYMKGGYKCNWYHHSYMYLDQSMSLSHALQ